MRALRDLLDVSTPGRLPSRTLLPTGPQSRLKTAAGFGKYGVQYCCRATASREIMQPALPVGSVSV